MKKTLQTLVLLLLMSLLPLTPLFATTYTYSDFSDVSSLQLNGHATQYNGDTLRLTPAAFNRAGSAFIADPVTIDNDYSFSSYFSFRMTETGGTLNEKGADGIAFLVQTNSNTVGGAGAGIGYSNVTNSVAVEYDTFFNSGYDINGNHIGIGLNGNLNSAASTAVATDMNDGNIWHSWVDYDGASNTMEVRISDTNIRSAAANLSYNVDLTSILNTSAAYVGFTSATGSCFNNHDILSWTFVDDYQPIDPGGSPVPEPTTMLLFGIGLLGIAGAGRKNQ